MQTLLTGMGVLLHRWYSAEQRAHSLEAERWRAEFYYVVSRIVHQLTPVVLRGNWPAVPKIVKMVTPLRVSHALSTKIRSMFTARLSNGAIWSTALAAYDPSVITKFDSYLNRASIETAVKYVSLTTSALTLLILIGFLRTVSLEARAFQKSIQSKFDKALELRNRTVRVATLIFRESASGLDFLWKHQDHLCSQLCEVCSGGLYRYDPKLGLVPTGRGFPQFSGSDVEILALPDLQQHFDDLDGIINEVRQSGIEDAYRTVHQSVYYEYLALGLYGEQPLSGLFRLLDRQRFAESIRYQADRCKDTGRKISLAWLAENHLLPETEWTVELGEARPKDVLTRAQDELLKEVHSFRDVLNRLAGETVYTQIALEQYCNNAPKGYLSWLWSLLPK